MAAMKAIGTMKRFISGVTSVLRAGVSSVRPAVA